MARIRFIGGAPEGYPITPDGGGVAGCGWFTDLLDEWPATPSDEQTLLWPVTVTLRQAMRWFWKIRRWQFDWSFTDTGVPFSGSAISYVDGVYHPREEREISAQATRDWTFPGFPADGIFTWGVHINGPRVYQQGDLFRPPMSFHAPNAFTTIQNTGLLGGTLNLNGSTIPVYVFNADVGNVDFTIMPYEFYPYESIHGGDPIYDSVTGDRIRDPFQFQDPYS